MYLMTHERASVGTGLLFGRAECQRKYVLVDDSTVELKFQLNNKALPHMLMENGVVCLYYGWTRNCSISGSRFNARVFSSCMFYSKQSSIPPQAMHTRTTTSKYQTRTELGVQIKLEKNNNTHTHNNDQFKTSNHIHKGRRIKSKESDAQNATDSGCKP